MQGDFDKHRARYVSQDELESSLRLVLPWLWLSYAGKTKWEYIRGRYER